MHEIARGSPRRPGVRYLDNAPAVVSHAQAILADDTVTFAAEGDLRDPEGLLASPAVRSRPASATLQAAMQKASGESSSGYPGR